MASFPVPRRAACAEQGDRMFPLDESERVEAGPTRGERQALALCAGCPVLAECRADVLEAPLPYGVAGGLTAAERRAVRAVRRGLALDPEADRAAA